MSTIENIIVISWIALILGLAFFFVYSLMFSTPFYPSSVKKLDQAFKDFDIKTNSGTKFIDLGSGDGRTLIWAAKNGMIATGIEQNTYLVLLSRLLVLLYKAKNIKVINWSFYKHNYSEYDIIYLYIYPEHMEKLKLKLFSEMNTDAVIISNTFKFKDVEPAQTSGHFYLYKKNN